MIRWIMPWTLADRTPYLDPIQQSACSQGQFWFRIITMLFLPIRLCTSLMLADEKEGEETMQCDCDAMRRHVKPERNPQASPV